MRSPAATLDLRAALSKEVRAALTALSSESVEGKAVHRCRVRLKRARALARVGRASAPGLAAVFNESARTLMAALGETRDLAALSAFARDCADRAHGKKEASALVTVAKALERGRALAPPPDLDAMRAGLRDLLAMAQVWPEASPRQLTKGAERIAVRARRAQRSGEGSNAAHDRHEWRKREKDRLYAMSLLDAAWPSERKRRRRKTEALADLLGRERDARLLAKRVKRKPALAGGDQAAGRARSALKRTLKRLSRKADALGQEVHAGRA